MNPCPQAHQLEASLRADLAQPAACQDLIRRLLTALPSARLGSLPGGARDIFVHPFFAGFPWEDLLQGAPLGSTPGQRMPGQSTWPSEEAQTAARNQLTEKRLSLPTCFW